MRGTGLEVDGLSEKSDCRGPSELLGPPHGQSSVPRVGRGPIGEPAGGNFQSGIQLWASAGNPPGSWGK